MLAACSSDPAPDASDPVGAAPTADANQEASSTQSAVEVDAVQDDGGAGRFDIDAATTMREVFDALSGTEQACIREAFADDVLESELDTPLLSDNQLSGTAILLCLDPENAREFFLSLAKATLVAAAEEEGLSVQVGADAEACMRDLISDVDVATLVSEPESDVVEEFDVAGLMGASDLTFGLFACSPDVFVASMGGLAPGEESCVRGLLTEVAAGDYRSGLASDPELDDLLESESRLASLGPLLGLTLDLFACAPDILVDSDAVDPPTAPDEADDHADVLERATYVDVYETAKGAIAHDGDIDFFVFSAEAGTTYEIDVALETLPDSTMTLYASDGTELEFNDDYGDSAASRIEWRAGSRGDYYLAVQGFAGSTGTYSLTVASLTDGSEPTDQPPAEDDTGNAVLDDHADVLERATSVDLGETMPGEIDGDDDIDFFVFRAEEGMRYRIDVALGSMHDSTTTLYDADGIELASHSHDVDYYDDYLGAPGDDPWESRVLWQADDTGDHYVAVGGRGSTGTYTLTVTLHTFLDDHADVLDSATSVSVGEAVPGALDVEGYEGYMDFVEGDIDFFVFRAEQGMRYQIELALGSMPNSTTILYDADGFELASHSQHLDRYEHDTWESRVLWQADYTGDHYVAVGDSRGTYTLTVVLDDHADASDSATSVSVGEAVPGAIDVEGDTDYFVFRAEQGMRYQIEVALGTLPGSTASLYGDGPYELTGEYNYTDASRIHWRAEYTGDHYVAVQGPRGMYTGTDTGTYTLTVTLSAFLDDDTDDLPETVEPDDTGKG